MLLVKHLLHWLGQVARMRDDCFPKQLLLGNYIYDYQYALFSWTTVMVENCGLRIGLNALSWCDVALDVS